MFDTLLASHTVGAHRNAVESPVPPDSSPSVFSTAEVDELPELAEELHPRYPERYATPV